MSATITTLPGTATTARPQREAIESLLIDPVTRVSGGLAARVDHDGEAITDAYLAGTSFRGYEPILVGRDPRDTMGLSSRSCGWCGSVHATTASMALEMAWGLRPPPMALALRTVAEATESIWVSAAHLAVRAGPDYCGPVVRRTTPWLWEAAQRTEAPGAVLHGYKTIGDLMEGLTPVEGRYWRETLPAGRRVLEMIALIYGKFPHPSVLAPGGIGATLTVGNTVGNFTQYYTRLTRSVDYVKQVCALWDDLVDFLLAQDPRFATLGERPASFIHAGAWDDADAYEATHAGLDADGRRRLASPGVIADGALVTESLREVHQDITEDVGHSFYEAWNEPGNSALDGSALPSRHPWNKTTLPAPAARQADGPYSWCTAPRWRGGVFETTPLGRLWLTALRDDLPENQFIEATGTSVKILVPVNLQPEIEIEWHIPQRNNALERLRADAYNVAFSGLCAAIGLLKGFELVRRGETQVANRFEVDQGEAAGVGLWESGRGMNAHWLRSEGGRLCVYQILGPSTWNASPRDNNGQPGPVEQALIDSPVIEEPQNGRLMGIDALRVIHSYDPCMNCGTH